MIEKKSAYFFEDFKLELEDKILFHDKKTLSLTPKMFDTLVVLLENSGKVIEKDDLIQKVWHDCFVEDNTLTFNIKMLRRVLGDDAKNPKFIETVRGRGYRFIAEIKKPLAENNDSATPETNINSVSQTKGFNESESDNPVEIYEPLINEVQTLKQNNYLTVHQSQTKDFVFANQKRIISLTVLIALISVGVSIWIYAGNWRSRAQNKSKVTGEQINNRFVYEQLTFNGAAALATISPDSKYIAFVLSENGKQSLWLRQLSTARNVQIIQPLEILYFCLEFSPDSEQIFFVKGESGATTELHSMPIFGGRTTKILTGSQGQISVSSDGKKLAFIRDSHSNGERESSLFVADIDGKNERKLSTKQMPDSLWVPTWSPDGSSVLCVSGNTESSKPSVRLIEIDSQTGAERLLLKPDWFLIKDVGWLPDKSGIVMLVKEKLSLVTRFWKMEYPGGELKPLDDGLNDYISFSMNSSGNKIITTSARFDSQIWITPDGKESSAREAMDGFYEFNWMPDNRIVYCSQISGNADIWIANTDGTQRTQLTSNSGFNAVPVATSDMRYIVFSSDRTGTHHIWRMNLDGSNQMQLTNGIGEKHATVSPDGKWVFYNSVDKYTLWKVSIEGGEPEKLTDEYAAYPSVSHDGEMIAYYKKKNDSKSIISISHLSDMKKIKTFDLAFGKLASLKLDWDSKNQSVIYADEKDGVINLMRQPLNGEHPQTISTFKAEGVFYFAWSPDYKQFAFLRGKWRKDAVMISD